LCGICGLVSNINPPDGIIEKMVDSLRHRGPDDLGSTLFANCHLGHRRLSIIDLSTGNQPMTEISQRYWITFNGEIYNYQELRQNLEQRGNIFLTNSDTEVILIGYKQFGVEIVTKLIGQFAFAIWDTQEHKLFAARDRFGEKPFFYAFAPSQILVFSSEIKGIIASGLFQPELDLISVDAYLGLLYVPPDRTIYSNIHVLPPAHYLIWNSGHVQVQRYWKPILSTQKNIEVEDITSQIRYLIEKAVERQLVADVPVGAFLSGGYDSSTIVALMAQKTNKKVQTYSVGFRDLINELPFARSVADRYGTSHHEINIDIPVVDMLSKMAEVYDEPIGDSSNIPTFLVSEFASKTIKVVLSGDGGDELFGGYEWYSLLGEGINQRGNITDVVALYSTQKILRAISRIGLHNENLSRKVDTLYYQSKTRYQFSDIWDRHLNYSSLLFLNRKKYWGNRLVNDCFQDIKKPFSPETSIKGLDIAVDFDLNCYLPGDILVKVDRAAMANGLETRAPFLDVDLVDFVLSIPSDVRISTKRNKPLLQDACSDLWPDLIKKRTKQGFGSPIWAWLELAELKELVRKMCSKTSPLVLLLPGIQNLDPNGESPQFIWNLLTLYIWLEKRSECLRNLV
jgi:asparagine synthase (glutamine-hydrolysing)